MTLNLLPPPRSGPAPKVWCAVNGWLLVSVGTHWAWSQSGSIEPFRCLGCDRPVRNVDIYCADCNPNRPRQIERMPA